MSFILTLKRLLTLVSHNKLLIKLIAYGIYDNFFDWITAYLSNRKQALRVCNILSDFVPVMSDVPQGSVLGPALFLLFINDACDIFGRLSVTCKLYVDGIKLNTSYCLTQTHSDLVTVTQRLIRWADTWQLTLAADKCTVCLLAQPGGRSVGITIPQSIKLIMFTSVFRSCA